MIRRLILASVIVALVSGTAFAQSPVGFSPFNTPAKPPPTPEEIARQRAIDDAYKSATKKIPDKRQADDPWSDVRTTPASPSTPKKSITVKQSTTLKSQQQ